MNTLEKNIIAVVFKCMYILLSPILSFDIYPGKIHEEMNKEECGKVFIEEWLVIIK